VKKRGKEAIMRLGVRGIKMIKIIKRKKVNNI
jgi:hypothetical protein